MSDRDTRSCDHSITEEVRLPRMATCVAELVLAAMNSPALHCQPPVPSQGSRCVYLV